MSKLWIKLLFTYEKEITNMDTVAYHYMHTLGKLGLYILVEDWE